MLHRSTTGVVLTWIFLFASTSTGQTITNTAGNFGTISELSWNDQMVLNSIRVIHSAEMAYRNSFGNGNYATLQQLQQSELIDNAFSTGQRYGYTFRIVVRYATATMQPGFELTATPSVRRPRFLSFYMNEACDIRGAERSGRDATINDPIVQACGTSIRTENEYDAVRSMRTIHNGQLTYFSSFGNGQFATPEQLFNTGMVTTGFILSYVWKGYTAVFSVTPGTVTEPARFSVSIVPNLYGRTGIRSFYIDQTGVLRGGDKNGDPAGPNDPPITE